MTTTTPDQWRRARNLSADQTGSIHDDDQARSLGFQAALIGGSITCAFAVERLVHRFGEAWHERGFLKQAFIAPLYEIDDFRVLVGDLDPDEGDEALVSVALEKRDGGRVTAGYAGLTAAAGPGVPPWERPGEQPSQSIGGDPLPGVAVGAEYPTYTRTLTVAESQSRREMTGDASSWYAERSPWGGPVMPSFQYMLLGGGGAPEGGFRADPPIRAGMNGTFQLQQFGPLMIGEPYTIAGSLAEKGFSTRSAYRTNEFTVTDVGGRRVAIARQKARWMASPR
jgi:hypothetical protein